MRKNKITLSHIACFVALQCSLPVALPGYAREYFNPAMLGIDGPGKDITDLSAFEEGVGQMPGTYHVDVVINNAAQGTYDIPFSMQKTPKVSRAYSPA